MSAVSCRIASRRTRPGTSTPWRLIVAAETVHTTIETGQNTAFYTGKVAVASFFTTSVLPHLTADLAVVSGTDLPIRGCVACVAIRGLHTAGKRPAARPHRIRLLRVSTSGAPVTSG
ncbi:acyl-CoA dehydrogenase C-terminal domain-containing protein [Nocardia sp. NPDC058114]|uniref:acyl-CoA dehydrogenase C-terminal domain-containing protein n=1 Tax=Nocardia sp. NPDC058114 TaxID=3346346 RepID=UPI0036DE9CCF